MTLKSKLPRNSVDSTFSTCLLSRTENAEYTEFRGIFIFWPKFCKIYFSHFWTLKKSNPKSKIFRGIPWIPHFRPARRLRPKTRNPRNPTEFSFFGQNLLKIHFYIFELFRKFDPKIENFPQNPWIPRFRPVCRLGLKHGIHGIVVF